MTVLLSRLQARPSHDFAKLTFGSTHQPEQIIGHGGLHCRRQAYPCRVLAVERKSPACDVVTAKIHASSHQLGAKFECVSARVPGEIVVWLDYGIPIGIGSIRRVAERGQPGELNVGRAPVGRRVQYIWNAELADHIDLIASEISVY